MDTSSEELRINALLAKERYDSGEDIFLLDSRSDEQFEKADSKASGAVHWEAGEIEKHLNEIPANKTVLIYCT